MMDFEDLVDMDWVNNNTVVYSEDEDQFKEPLMMNESIDIPPTVDAPSDDALLVAPPVLPGPGMMPTTEQIKMLIEAAKRHLMLRDQQQQPAEQSLLTAAPSLFPTQPETVAPEALVKLPELQASDYNTVAAGAEEEAATMSRAARRESTASLDDSLALEHYGEADIKKLTPKERRQLRNKISARNFRVRRKEYITTLEAQIDEHKQKADLLQERLNKSEDENRQLRTEMASLRSQNQHLLQKQADKTPPSPTMALQAGLNKDISAHGKTAPERYHQESCILVSSAVVPNWDIHAILASPHPPSTSESDLQQAAACFLLGCAQLYTTKTTVALQACRAASRLEDLYDSLLIGTLINSSANADRKSFCWWMNAAA